MSDIRIINEDGVLRGYDPETDERVPIEFGSTGIAALEDTAFFAAEWNSINDIHDIAGEGTTVVLPSRSWDEPNGVEVSENGFSIHGWNHFGNSSQLRRAADGDLIRFGETDSSGQSNRPTGVVMRDIMLQGSGSKGAGIHHVNSGNAHFYNLYCMHTEKGLHIDARVRTNRLIDHYYEHCVWEGCHDHGIHIEVADGTGSSPPPRRFDFTGGYSYGNDGDGARWEMHGDDSISRSQMRGVELGANSGYGLHLIGARRNRFSNMWIHGNDRGAIRLAPSHSGHPAIRNSFVNCIIDGDIVLDDHNTPTKFIGGRFDGRVVERGTGDSRSLEMIGVGGWRNVEHYRSRYRHGDVRRTTLDDSIRTVQVTSEENGIYAGASVVGNAGIEFDIRDIATGEPVERGVPLSYIAFGETFPTTF